MALSVEQIKEKATERKSKQNIMLALLHQNRIRFHGEVIPSTPALALQMTRNYKGGVPFLAGREGISQALYDFMAMVKNLIPDDKFQVFKTLFRFPVATNDILDTCYDKLSRIFDGRDPAFAYQFTSPEYRDDWEWYRQEKLGEPTIWKTKGWEYFKTQINSVLVCDLPQEQEAGDRYPQPYFYWLPIRDVIDYKAKENGMMEYIIFRQDGEKIAVIDDEYYRIFEGKNNEIGMLISEERHDLGYCPARFFWNEPMSIDRPDIKQSPVTKELGKLDWYLFYATSKQHLDLYGSYPIYWGFAETCDYHDEETGRYCENGFLKDEKQHWVYDNNGAMVQCPICSKRRLVGAGSMIDVPVPAEGQPDLSNPVGMLAVDRQSLDYNKEEEDRLRTNIITSIVGTNEEITTRDALNEQQIKANFESQSTVLKQVAKHFEEAQKFVDDTICRLRYGKAFLSSSISYGTEFYLLTSDELRARYEIAKKAGMSEADLDALLQQIIETEYRHNPLMMQRMIILGDLEPYRHLTRSEVQGLYDKSLIPVSQLMIKLNFSDFIRRFERENTNIIDFGEQLDYDKKIATIEERLTEYANEAVEKNKVNPIKEEEI